MYIIEPALQHCLEPRARHRISIKLSTRIFATEYVDPHRIKFGEPMFSGHRNRSESFSSSTSASTSSTASILARKGACGCLCKRDTSSCQSSSSSLQYRRPMQNHRCRLPRPHQTPTLRLQPIPCASCCPPDSSSVPGSVIQYPRPDGNRQHWKSDRVGFLIDIDSTD